MKSLKTKILLFLALALITPLTINAQEEDEASSSASIDGGLDIYSSYIWRGSKFGSGPAFQPWVEGALGGLSLGAWGSVNASTDEALEMDLYLGYSFDFGLGITVTDYYFGGYENDSAEFMSGEFFSYDKAHYIEPALSFEVGNLSLLAAYMFAPNFEEGDMYFEAGYAIGALSLTTGAGDGAYTKDGDFMLCNITISTSKEIKITDNFTLPLSASVTLNPSTEGFFITAGVSF